MSDELSVDKFHEKESQLFQVVERIQMADQIGIAPHIVGLLGEAIEEKIPEVEYAVSGRLLRENKILSVGDNNINTTGLYASQNVFNMFSYDLLQVLVFIFFQRVVTVDRYVFKNQPLHKHQRHMQG